MVAQTQGLTVNYQSRKAKHGEIRKQQRNLGGQRHLRSGAGAIHRLATGRD